MKKLIKNNFNKIGKIRSGEYANWFIAYTGNIEDGYYIYIWKDDTIYDDYCDNYELLEAEMKFYLVDWTEEEIPENMKDISD